MNWCWRDRKLKAFTITELLVGMVISGIVVAAAWTALDLISKRFQLVERSRQSAEEISFFYRCLVVDYDAADVCVQEQHQLTFLDQDSVPIAVYHIAEQRTVRINRACADTFHVTVQTVDNGIEMHDQLELNIRNGGELIPLRIDRIITSKERMQEHD